MKNWIILNKEGKSNYHTHTHYCDGKNSPREMVQGALSLGFESLGFSGHQFSEPDKDYAMGPEAEENYKKDILELREEYRDKINIYLGIERDYCSEVTPGFDYVIGSCHHIEKDGVWICVDYSPEYTENAVREYFGGDYMEYVRTYYDLVSHVLEKTEGQIVGHFDLVSKFNRGNKYFDEDSPIYQRLAIEAADRLIDEFRNSNRWENVPEGFPKELMPAIETGFPIFEINTGAMTNGRRDIPYPAPFLLNHLADKGVPMILSSDCHNVEYLNYGLSVDILPIK